jgi:taurine dioxygenase
LPRGAPPQHRRRQRQRRRSRADGDRHQFQRRPAGDRRRDRHPGRHLPRSARCRPASRRRCAELPRENNGWHIDITFVANPAKASILLGKVVPPYGGDTLWSNLVAAYEGLSPKLRSFVDNLQAVHGAGGYDRVETGKRKAVGPHVSVHPVVRVHPETGERALFINPGVTRRILGLHAGESQKLLEILVAEVTRPRYQVRFRWERSSIAFWDNRVTAHAGPIDFQYFDLPRTVHRVTLTGDLPVGPDGFVSRPVEGELFD